MSRNIRPVSFLVQCPNDTPAERASYSTSLGEQTAFDYARQNASRYGGVVYAVDAAGKLHFSHSYSDRSRFPQ